MNITTHGIKFAPFGCRRDLEDNEWVYSNMVLDQDWHDSQNNLRHGLKCGITLLYPYAFVFLPTDEDNDNDAFVYHTMILFENMNSEIVKDKDEIMNSDRLSVNLNDLNAKKVLVDALKAKLEQKKKESMDRFTLDDQKALTSANEWLEGYEESDWHCNDLRIVPMHLNLSSDDNMPLSQFTPYDDAKHLSCDKDREMAIFRQEHEWNVGQAKGCEIDMVNTGPVTMTVDWLPDATVVTTSGGATDVQKNITQVIHEKGIKSYDLYTFVIKEVDLDTEYAEYSIYNIFWDGDLAEFDDTPENMDRMLYDVAGSDGFNVFDDFMRRNKFLPDSMVRKFEEDRYSVSTEYRVIGVYRTQFSLKDTIKINYKNVHAVLPLSRTVPNT